MLPALLSRPAPEPFGRLTFSVALRGPAARLLPALLLPLLACSAPAPPAAPEPVYRRERTFTFRATHTSSWGWPLGEDTVVLVSSAQRVNAAGQTRSTWQVLGPPAATSVAGITENDTTTWLHPPRSGAYRVLELSPFPMAQHPLTPGRRWHGPLRVGSRYTGPGAATGPAGPDVLFSTHYRVAGTERLRTPLGRLACVRIDGHTRSALRRTRLTAYFHPRYGFVRLDYRNIDGGRLRLDLLHVAPVKFGPGAAPAG